MKQEELEATLKEATARLTAELAPEQVWLFGSHAWGEPGEHSDLDFFVIVPESEEPASQRMHRAYRCLTGLNVATDVVVQTRRQVDRYKHLRSTLLHKVINEGRLLYG